MIFYLQISIDDLGSPLVPVLTNIFMIQLKSLLILFLLKKDAGESMCVRMTV